MKTATTTAIVSSERPSTLTRRTSKKVNGSRKQQLEAAKARAAESFRLYAQKKYRHVAAVHSTPRTSCLSHESPTTPSFIGFRNLMVIVLGKSIHPLPAL